MHDKKLQKDNSPSPIKDIIYEEIGRKDKDIRDAITARKFRGITKKILDDCLPAVSALKGDEDEDFCSFAEGMLHYLLTNAIIPSQRKILINDIEADIVVPDSRTLAASPKDALVLFFARKDDDVSLAKSLSKLQKIQPVKENIWLVARKDPKMHHKTYEIGQSGSFADIMDHIEEFTRSRPQSRLRIFKINS